MSRKFEIGNKVRFIPSGDVEVNRLALIYADDLIAQSKDGGAK